MRPVDPIKLLQKLEDEETLELIVPYPFLPPRFKILAAERNMRLVFNGAMKAEALWEGSQLSDCIHLSSREASRLLKDVSRILLKYRADLFELGVFLGGLRVPKALHPGVADPSLEPREALAEERSSEAGSSSPAAENKPKEPQTLGGESPLPPWDY